MTRERLCHILAALIGLLIITPVLIMVMDRRDPAILQWGWIEPDDVAIGQETTLTWRIRETRVGCMGEASSYIIDSTNKVHEFAAVSTTYNIEKGKIVARPGNYDYSRKLIIPGGIALGSAIYGVRVKRWCNDLQRRLWPISSRGLEVPFNVIKSSGEK